MYHHVAMSEIEAQIPPPKVRHGQTSSTPVRTRSPLGAHSRTRTRGFPLPALLHQELALLGKLVPSNVGRHHTLAGDIGTTRIRHLREIARYGKKHGTP